MPLEPVTAFQKAMARRRVASLDVPSWASTGGWGLLGSAGPPQLSIPALNPDGTALEKTQIDSDSADVGRT